MISRKTAKDRYIDFRVRTMIVGNQDGPNGRNETYGIGTRTNVPRTEAVKGVEQGDYPGYHVIKVEGRKYVRDNPDPSKRDNVNRGR